MFSLVLWGVLLLSIQGWASVNNHISSNEMRTSSQHPPKLYPKEWVPLEKLTKKLSCDSIAKLSDTRISVLYTENLQLKSQYKRLELEFKALQNKKRR